MDTPITNFYRSRSNGSTGRAAVLAPDFNRGGLGRTAVLSYDLLQVMLLFARHSGRLVVRSSNAADRGLIGPSVGRHHRLIFHASGLLGYTCLSAVPIFTLRMASLADR